MQNYNIKNIAVQYKTTRKPTLTLILPEAPPYLRKGSVETAAAPSQALGRVSTGSVGHKPPASLIQHPPVSPASRRLPALVWQQQ